jgi:hypothetical protein
MAESGDLFFACSLSRVVSLKSLLPRLPVVLPKPSRSLSSIINAALSGNCESSLESVLLAGLRVPAGEACASAFSLVFSTTAVVLPYNSSRISSASDFFFLSSFFACSASIFALLTFAPPPSAETDAITATSS